MTLPATVSPAVRKLNPHLFGGQAVGPAPLPVDKPRIRQKRTPLNKTEQRFLDWLKAQLEEGDTIYTQAVTFALGNGARYTPDFVVRSNDSLGSMLIAYEVKGPHMYEDARVKLVVAARAFPWVHWRLAYEKPPRSGQFVIEEVLP